MALTRRGKQVIGGVAIAGVLGVGGLALSGNSPALQRAVDAVTDLAAPPPTCPLTGEETRDAAETPDRPLLAVKVENTEAAYPLVGLDRADMVYEEVVEGGITRFVVLFHCRDAGRVGPVRSARTTDPKILSQFQQGPVLAYSGGAPKVVKSLVDAKVVQLTEANTSAAFTRDAARIAPHDLFTSTGALWRAALDLVEDPAIPSSIFDLDEALPEGGRRARSVSIVFSTLSSTGWTWGGGVWTRQLEGAAMALEGGVPITADNVVVQSVEVSQDTIRDASGSFSPLVEMMGRGKAWVFRDGRVLAGTWERASATDVTVFRTKTGDEIALAPGVTWVELVPTDGEVTIGQ